jgi:hypothetical protein
MTPLVHWAEECALRPSIFSRVWRRAGEFPGPQGAFATTGRDVRAGGDGGGRVEHAGRDIDTLGAT